MSADGIRILLVDDQELVRAGFRVMLSSRPGFEVVGEGADGEAAIALARELRPDVICMDVQMPVMDGLEATRRIVADPEAAGTVLVLTTFDDDDSLFRALDAGASGFLLKTATPEQLAEAVQVLAAGDALLAPAVTRRVIERSECMSRDDFPDCGSRPRTGSAGAVREGSEEPVEEADLCRSLPAAQPPLKLRWVRRSLRRRRKAGSHITT